MEQQVRSISALFFWLLSVSLCLSLCVLHLSARWLTRAIVGRHGKQLVRLQTLVIQSLFNQSNAITWSRAPPPRKGRFACEEGEGQIPTTSWPHIALALVRTTSLQRPTT